MTKVKLVCALAWRENFAKDNNSVTDTKRRMHDSPTLRQSTSWTSDGEGHVRWQRIILLSERSMVNEECPSTRKGTMQWKSKTEERDKLAYFCLPIAEMDYYDLSPTPPVFKHFNLMTGEVSNGFVGERFKNK